MAIHVSPEQAATWRRRLAEAEVTGEFPLPAVDTLVVRPGGTPAISLVAPGIVPGTDEIFVSVEAMPAEERALLRDLIRLLAERAGVVQPLSLVRHLGGLDYELVGADPAAAGVRLSDLAPGVAYWLSQVLGFVAELGQRFPNEAASHPRLVNTNTTP